MGGADEDQGQPRRLGGAAAFSRLPALRTKLRTLSQVKFIARESTGYLRADDCVELGFEKKHGGRNVEVGHCDDNRGQIPEC